MNTVHTYMCAQGNKRWSQGMIMVIFWERWRTDLKCPCSSVYCFVVQYEVLSNNLAESSKRTLTALCTINGKKLWICFRYKALPMMVTGHWSPPAVQVPPYTLYHNSTHTLSQFCCFSKGKSSKETFEEQGRWPFRQPGGAVQEEADGLQWQEHKREEKQVVWYLVSVRERKRNIEILE